MRGEAKQISSTLATPRAVSKIAWMRIGRSRPALASSCASSFFVGHRNPVLEVGDENVDGSCHCGDLGANLFVVRREEMKHPARSERNLPNRFGSTDGEGLEEVLWRSHALTLGGFGSAGETAEPFRKPGGTPLTGQGAMGGDRARSDLVANRQQVGHLKGGA